MIKAETVKEKDCMHVKSTVEGMGGELLHEFANIVENLRDNIPEEILLSAFTKGCANYDIKHNKDKCKEELRGFLKELLNDLQ